MELARLVEAVEQVRASTKKSEKIRVLAETLRATHGHESVLTALYLSGSLPQGKIGIGWNLIQQAIGKGVVLSTPGWVGEKERSSSALAAERLTLSDGDKVFDRLAAERGPGSTERRLAELAKFFSHARPDERR